MERLYTEFLSNEPLVKWLKKIEQKELIISNYENRGKKLSLMISLITSGIPLPTLIVFKNDISEVICDNCSIFEFHEFYNNKIPIKYNFNAFFSNKEFFDIEDLYFHELPKKISIQIQQARISVINIYSNNRLSKDVIAMLKETWEIHHQ